MSQKRISYFDMAKGIGILLVLIGHSGFPSAALIQWISSFHMPLFFLLSGMLFAHTKTAEKKTRPFLKKNACSILLPYASFSILSILAAAILEFDLFPEYLWNALLETLSFYGISVLWFLPVLFFSKTIFFFLVKKGKKQTTVCFTLAILALTICGNELSHRFFPISDTLPLLFIHYLTAVFLRTGIAVSFVAFGFFIYRPFAVYMKNHSTANHLLLSAGFLLLNLLFGFKNGGVDLNQLVFHNYLLYYLAAICGSMAVLCLCYALPESRILLYLGKNSLIIMATHMNCRFLGACYLAADFFVQRFPQSGLFGYYFITAICMALLEVTAIFLIHRFFPFLIGQKARKA